MAEQKRVYKKPELVVHGDVEVLTHKLVGIGQLDQPFPANTPVVDLRFTQ